MALGRPTSPALAFPLMSASSSLSSSLSFLMQSKYSFCLSRAWPHMRKDKREEKRQRRSWTDSGQTCNTTCYSKTCSETCSVHIKPTRTQKQTVHTDEDKATCSETMLLGEVKMWKSTGTDDTESVRRQIFLTSQKLHVSMMLLS